MPHAARTSSRRLYPSRPLVHFTQGTGVDSILDRALVVEGETSATTTDYNSYARPHFHNNTLL